MKNWVKHLIDAGLIILSAGGAAVAVYSYGETKYYEGRLSSCKEIMRDLNRMEKKISDQRREEEAT